MEPRPESIVSQHSAAAACVRMSTSVVDQEIMKEELRHGEREPSLARASFARNPRCKSVEHFDNREPVPPLKCSKERTNCYGNSCMSLNVDGETKMVKLEVKLVGNLMKNVH